MYLFCVRHLLRLVGFAELVEDVRGDLVSVDVLELRRVDLGRHVAGGGAVAEDVERDSSSFDQAKPWSLRMGVATQRTPVATIAEAAACPSSSSARTVERASAGSMAGS